VPTVNQSTDIEAPVERVWRVVSDPHSLPRWWPRVQRVEEVTGEAWTTVLASDRGKPIRADYSLVLARPMEVYEWEQELAETPFERMLSESRLRITVTDAKLGITCVTLRSTERLRGLARLGAPMVRRATRRRLNEALTRLAELVDDGA
jgi:uncharacterized protein YndB with AHSA1/START domain